MQKVVYLDYAAASPVDPEVVKAMQPYHTNMFYNPSAIYSGARDVKSALHTARADVALSIGSKPSEVIFVSGGTESANLAISGVMDQFPGSEVVISAVEHDAVRKPAQKYDYRVCSVDAKARINLSELRTHKTEKTVLVSVMYANNEVGTVQPIKEVVGLVESIRSARAKSGNKMPLYVHTDACQAPQYLDINVARLGVDLMTLNGGKIYGPKQSGILYKKASVLLSPQIVGGGQEFGIRSGTENIASAVGFALSLQLAVSRRSSTHKHARTLGTYFIDTLMSTFGAVINGDRKQRLPNNVHATFPGVDNERVLYSLDAQGVWAAAGSACSASSEESSHVLLAMGMNDEDSRASVRFSIGKNTTKEDIDYTIRALHVALRA